MNKFLRADELLAAQSKGIFRFMPTQDSIQTRDSGIGSNVGFNLNLPQGLLTAISPKRLKIITRKRTSELVIGGKAKLLSWPDNDVVIPVTEPTGETVPYGDFADVPAGSINPNIVQRGHYLFSSKIQVGNRATQQLDRLRIASTADTTDASLEALAITLNNVAFYGAVKPEASLYNIYGILTDPSLGNYIPATSTTAAVTFASFYKDIQTIVQKIITQASGYVDMTTPMRVALAGTRYSYLTLENSFGKTISQIVKENYPNLQFILVPEFVAAYNGQDVMYCIAENEVAGEDRTGDIGFSELALASSVIVMANGTEQIISSGTCGSVFYKPYNIARMSFTA